MISLLSRQEKFNQLISLTHKGREAYADMVRAVEHEIAENPPPSLTAGSSLPSIYAHMGHSRTPSGCSAISFTSSVLSEPISENYPHAEPETDSKGYEIVRDPEGKVVPAGLLRGCHHNGSGGGGSAGAAEAQAPYQPPVDDFDDGNEADTEDINDGPPRKTWGGGSVGGGGSSSSEDPAATAMVVAASDELVDGGRIEGSNHALGPVSNHTLAPVSNHTTLVGPALNHTLGPASNHTLGSVPNHHHHHNMLGPATPNHHHHHHHHHHSEGAEPRFPAPYEAEDGDACEGGREHSEEGGDSASESDSQRLGTAVAADLPHIDSIHSGCVLGGGGGSASASASAYEIHSAEILSQHSSRTVDTSEALSTHSSRTLGEGSLTPNTDPHGGVGGGARGERPHTPESSGGRVGSSSSSSSRVLRLTNKDRVQSWVESCLPEERATAITPPPPPLPSGGCRHNDTTSTDTDDGEGEGSSEVGGGVGEVRA